MKLKTKITGVLIVAILAASVFVLVNRNTKQSADQAPQNTSEAVVQSAVITDDERKTKVAAINTALLAYHTEKNELPSVSQLSDDNWIAQNLQNTDLNVFDLGNIGKNAITGEKFPTQSAYSYTLQDEQGNACAAAPCHGFIIAIMLEDKSVYSLQYPEHMSQHTSH